MTYEIEHLRAVAQALRRLRDSPAQTRKEAGRWYADAQAALDRVNDEFGRGVDLPPQVWHYLHDADLRLKDPAYGQAQDEMIDSVIADLERGVIPPSTGTTVALHPVWLVVVPVLLVLGVLYWFAVAH